MKNYGITQFGWMGRSATSPEASRIDTLAIEREARQRRDESLAAGLTAFGQVLGRLARRIASWQERRATYAELTRLDDRMLADIGLNRGDIRAAAELGALPSHSADVVQPGLIVAPEAAFIGRAANHNRPYKVA